jgi:hypothetical protein
MNRIIVPRGVLFLTLSLSRSPELMAESWGKRRRSRSDCVPLPTPGAPMRITRAALLRLIGARSRGLLCSANGEGR